MKYGIMYAKDTKRPPEANNTKIRTFDSRTSLLWFVMRDRLARASVLAGRVRFLEIGE